MAGTVGTLKSAYGLWRQHPAGEGSFAGMRCGYLAGWGHGDIGILNQNNFWALRFLV